MQRSQYTGHVVPSGDPATRLVGHTAATVAITKLSVGPMDNNCYIVADLDAGTGIIVDAANDADRILAAVGDLRISTILTTHRHRDHWQALAEVARATGAHVAHHAADASEIPVRADITVDQGDVIAVGAAEVTIQHTPGHTDGSVCALLDGAAEDRPQIAAHLFTGDTLFPGGPGATAGQAQFTQIMSSLRRRLFVLADATWVYPGHGDDTTLGDERDQLDEWQARGW